MFSYKELVTYSYKMICKKCINIKWVDTRSLIFSDITSHLFRSHVTWVQVKIALAKSDLKLRKIQMYALVLTSDYFCEDFMKIVRSQSI